MTQARKQSLRIPLEGQQRRRISDLRKLSDAYRQGDEEKYANELGTLSEYGLAFDYVAPGTFKDQEKGYWRYQISWGGPSDEFRFYAGGYGERSPYRISYVFLDWFDGHESALVGQDLELMRQIWRFSTEAGSTLRHSREIGSPAISVQVWSLEMAQNMKQQKCFIVEGKWLLPRAMSRLSFPTPPVSS